MKLIISEEKLKENRKNQLLKDKTKKNYEKQIRTKRIAFTIVIGLIILYFIGLIIMFDVKATEKARNNCLNQGYDLSYCLKNS